MVVVEEEHEAANTWLNAQHIGRRLAHAHLIELGQIAQRVVVLVRAAGPSNAVGPAAADLSIGTGGLVRLPDWPGPRENELAAFFGLFEEQQRREQSTDREIRVHVDLVVIVQAIICHSEVLAVLGRHEGSPVHSLHNRCNPCRPRRGVHCVLLRATPLRLGVGLRTAS